MTTDFDPFAVPISDAATVMLLRDRASGEGIEVFMLRRTIKAVFAGGLYVFPGGRVDRADSSPEIDALCPGIEDDTASDRLGIDSGGLAFWIAAIRECFEEAGVLLARTADGATVSFDDPEVEARFTAYRDQVHDGTLPLDELCRREGLVLDGASIGYVAHWLTPIGERRRFDTRFFVAYAPAGQRPLHDDGETIESFWVEPNDALGRHEAGELAMLPPTKATLQFLSGFTSVADVMAHVDAMDRPDK
ncbi:MAG: hypothetical protein KDA28_10840, partial [Phycisphaerales bacterium]|nr:hypothetical protein [Phycisphaerales bacterium]